LPVPAADAETSVEGAGLLAGKGPDKRREFFYWTDDGNCAALRYNNWKISFLKQEAHGLDVWRQPFVELRAPLICNLRMDPLERAEYEGMDYDQEKMKKQ